jgi:hypothetical protein
MVVRVVVVAMVAAASVYRCKCVGGGRSGGKQKQT